MKSLEGLRSHIANQAHQFQADAQDMGSFGRTVARIGVLALPLAGVSLAGCTPDTSNVVLPTPTRTSGSISSPTTLEQIRPLITPSHSDAGPSERGTLGLKEKVLTFTWTDAERPEALQEFTNILAESYLQFTKTPRLKKEDLVGEGRIIFYNDRATFLQSVRTAQPQFQISPNLRSFTDFDTRKVLIDTTTVKQQSASKTPSAGLAYLHDLWHEWGHLDITERTTGELLNNPSQAFFLSPVSGRNEPYRRYRGGEVKTDSHYGFLRFEEVWNDTIIARRMQEQIKLEDIIVAGDYYTNGVDFLIDFTRFHGITLGELYSLHATSDHEGFATRLGRQIPGDGTPLEKGRLLFLGIHNNDTTLLRAIGAKKQN